MKASALFIAAALAASGSALAQQYDSKSHDGKAPAHVKSSAEPKEGVGTKLKKALRRAGEKTKQAFNRGGDNRGNQQAAQSGPDTDTRRMGAGPASGTMGEEDRARRARMDDAYSNWRSRQKQ